MKFKNTKKVIKKAKSKKKVPQKEVKVIKTEEFPRNSRFITEGLGKIRLSSFFYPVLILFCLIIAFMIGFFSFGLVKNFHSFNKLENQRNQIISKINTWESITDKYQGYKDGYLQLAVLEYQLQNFEKSKLYLRKALKLDPNYKEAIEMGKVLKNY